MAIQAGEDTFYQAQREIIQDGLVLNLDPAVKASYTSGTTVYDLKKNNNGTLENQASFIKDNGGCFTLDGTDDFIRILSVPNINNSSISHSYCIWVRPRGNGNVISASNVNPQGSWNMPPISVAGGNITGKFWANNRHQTS